MAYQWIPAAIAAAGAILGGSMSSKGGKASAEGQQLAQHRAAQRSKRGAFVGGPQWFNAPYGMTPDRAREYASRVAQGRAEWQRAERERERRGLTEDDVRRPLGRYPLRQQGPVPFEDTNLGAYQKMFENIYEPARIQISDALRSGTQSVLRQFESDAEARGFGTSGYAQQGKLALEQAALNKLADLNLTTKMAERREGMAAAERGQQNVLGAVMQMPVMGGTVASMWPSMAQPTMDIFSNLAEGYANWNNARKKRETEREEFYGRPV